MNTDQEFEVNKYVMAYQHERYRMGANRKTYAQDVVRRAKSECITHLDVGCGRGEMVDFAKNLGYESTGTEVVDYLAERDNVILAPAWDLPMEDGSIDLVTCFDVIEHILPEDCMSVLKEINRVAGKQIYITANNMPSQSLGVELHVNKLPYLEWDKIFREVFDGEVEWLPRKYNIPSETWHVVK